MTVDLAAKQLLSPPEAADLAAKKILPPAEAAEYLDVTVGTLAQWRHHKRYPLKYIRVGRKIAYRVRDLEQFLDSRTQSGVEDVAPVKARRKYMRRAK